VYDNATEASGKILYKFVGSAIGSGGFYAVARDWQRPVECVDGLYASISGSSATYTVEYMRK